MSVNNSSPLSPSRFAELNLEETPPPNSCGSFFHNGKLYIFTLQKVDAEGKTTNLSFDEKQSVEVSSALSRLFETNAADETNSALSNSTEFCIPMSDKEIFSVKTNSSGVERTLDAEAVKFLETTNSRGFNFLQELHKTVFVANYNSAFLDSLDQEERLRREQLLISITNEEKIVDDITTNLRAPNYYDVHEIKASASRLHLSPKSLHTVSSAFARSSQGFVLPPLKISKTAPTPSSALTKLDTALTDDSIKSIAIPLHTYNKAGAQKATYGLFIDKESQTIYFYNPSNKEISKDSPEGKCVEEIYKKVYPDSFKDKIDLFWKNRSFRSKLSTKKHLGCHQTQYLRKIKHQLTPPEHRQADEKKALAQFPSSYNSGRYVLRFFDSMFRSSNFDNDFKKFTSKPLPRESIEQYSEKLSTALHENFYSRYNRIHAAVEPIS